MSVAGLASGNSRLAQGQAVVAESILLFLSSLLIVLYQGISSIFDVGDALRLFSAPQNFRSSRSSMRASCKWPPAGPGLHVELGKWVAVSIRCVSTKFAAIQCLRLLVQYHFEVLVLLACPQTSFPPHLHAFAECLSPRPPLPPPRALTASDNHFGHTKAGRPRDHHGVFRPYRRATSITAETSLRVSAPTEHGPEAARAKPRRFNVQSRL